MEEFIFPQGIEVNELTATECQIVMEPLERGFATTLGNALRRVLLSSIPGGAVVRVTFEGEYHEYDTIDGVKEDILEIILNIKDLALRLKDDEQQLLRIEKQGVAEVKANDIDLPNGVEIVNPDLHIATLNDSGALSIELEVESGFGYRAAEMNKPEDAHLAVIPIDSDFSPVRTVNFTVEDTRVGGRTGYERLILDISTNGGIKPEEAISEAVEILKKHLEFFDGFAEHPFSLSAMTELEPEVEDEESLGIPLEELEFDKRACNLLREAEITALDELLKHPREELLDIHGFGGKTLLKVENRLNELGYSLMDESEVENET